MSRCLEHSEGTGISLNYHWNLRSFEVVSSLLSLGKHPASVIIPRKVTGISLTTHRIFALLKRSSCVIIASVYCRSFSASKGDSAFSTSNFAEEIWHSVQTRKKQFSVVKVLSVCLRKKN